MLICAQSVPLFLSSPAFADDPSDAGLTQLQEVIVTAQKREQNLQDVGTSITAFNAEAISKLGFNSVTDIAMQVPGMQFNQVSPDLTIFNLRGVSQNDYSDHEEGPVAVYSDEAYVASLGAIAGSMFDLERVEVLRGPQGTLFGRNATGGLVQYVSQKPTDQPAAFVSATAGSFGEVDTEGFVNGPLSDSIDARFSFASNYHGNVVQNRSGEGSEDLKQYAARLQFLFKLNDDAQLLVKFHGITNPSMTGTGYTWSPAFPNPQTGLGEPVPPNVNLWGTCPGCDLGGYKNTGGPFNQAFNYPQYFDRTVYGSTVHLDWRLDHGMALTSVTDFMHMNKDYGEDSDISPNPLVHYNTSQSFHQFSEELRLSGQAGSLKWVTGIFFLDMYSQDWATTIFGGALADYGSSGPYYNLKTLTYAPFAQAEWSINDSWTAIVGARYTHDEKIYQYALTSPFGSLPPIYVFNTTADGSLADQTYNLPSWKGELDYKVTPDTLLYASVNRGAKGGGFNAPTSLPINSPTDIPFRPEELTDYEVGEKTTFWEGKARLNTGAFYYDYKEYQAFFFSGLSEFVNNYPATIKGGELELSLLPATGFELQAGVSRLSAVIKNVALPTGVITDRVMPQAPKWSVNMLARYQWQALNSTWWVQADSKTDSSMYYEAFNAPDDYQPGKTYANARIGFTSSDAKLDISAWCNNVTNKLYRVYSNDVSSVGFDALVLAPPRWYGVTVGYHF